MASAGAAQAAVGQVIEKAQDNVPVLRSTSGDGPLIVVEIGQPQVACGEFSSEVVEVRGWHREETDGLVVEVPSGARFSHRLASKGCAPGRGANHLVWPVASP